MIDSNQMYFNLVKSRFSSALWLDNKFPKFLRRAAAVVFDILIAFSLVSIISISVKSFDGAIKEKIADFFFLILSFRLIIFSFESFYRSATLEVRNNVSADASSILPLTGSKSASTPRTGLFAESRPVLGTTGLGANLADYFTFEAISLLAKTFSKHGMISGADVLKNFSKTKIGKFAFLHLGISAEDLAISKIFTETKIDFLIEEIFENSRKKNRSEIGISDIIAAVLEKDEKISRLFFEMNIKKEDIAGAIEWAESLFQKKEKKSRWWQEENLARVKGIAKDWAYGATYLLDRYSRAFGEYHPVGEHQIFHFTGHQKEIGAIETVLSRKAQANVLIVGEPGTGKRTAVAGLDEMINTGKVRPELEYKRLLELDAASIIAAAKTKGEVEELIIRLFNDAVKAGNIILIIDNFAEFLKSAESLGVSLGQVLNPYFASGNLQIIAISDSGGFKRFLEPNSSLMQYFEIVRIEEPNPAELFQVLEDVALEIEGRQRIIILYQTIRETANVANNYLTEGALPERAIDILEMASNRVAGSNIVRPEDISEFVSSKIKMPLGSLKPEEKEKLSNLEKILHQRVVDQEEAITSISAAVRRIRTGLAETKKPLASFLFLGPTGVGKTETAKALSAIYFGDEEAMTRFDMSEYQNENGLERLIGSFEKNEPGLLAVKLREKPYGLSLLDEFEKCHQKVMDLFLQILDEGFFTDAFGKKVFTRNNIVIATSNAASQLIWEIVRKGSDPSVLKESVIDAIQKQGIFKAELLNRFDAIIVFHPLSREHLKTIAKFMLEKLGKRLLEQKEINLVIDDVLIEKVAEIGYDPVFGARPMQRAIQERIEKKIAEWIISGKIDRGSKIEFKAEDLTGV